MMMDVTRRISRAGAPASNGSRNRLPLTVSPVTTYHDAFNPKSKIKNPI